MTTVTCDDVRLPLADALCSEGHVDTERWGTVMLEALEAASAGDVPVVAVLHDQILGPAASPRRLPIPVHGLEWTRDARWPTPQAGR